MRFEDDSSAKYIKKEIINDKLVFPKILKEDPFRREIQAPLDPSLFGFQVEETNPILGKFLSNFTLSGISVDSLINQGSSSRKPTLGEAAQIVNENGEIADYLPLQFDAIFGGGFGQKALALGLTEIELHSRMIGLTMRTCAESILEQARALPVGNPLRQLIDQLDLDMQSVERESEFHRMLNGFSGESKFLNAPETAHGRFIEMMLSEAGTRRELLKIIDVETTASTSRNLAEIDEASAQGGMVEKDFVIVGGGPLTAIAAAILSPFRDVTVITAEERLGEPMRSRPIFLNSSTDEDSPDARQLPFARGSTTPTNPRGMPNQPRIGEALLDDTALEVECDDGTKRKYLSAQRLGEGTAAAIRSNTADIITGQMVEIPVSSKGAYSRVVITDQMTGVKRELDSKSVLILGGPGREVSKFGDQDSSDLYEESAVQVKLQIERLRNAHKRGEEADFDFHLPSVLSLTTISDLLAAWDTYLDRDPRKYPLTSLLNTESRVAVLGSADTGRTMVELLTGSAPEDSYPYGYDNTKGTPSIIWYNQPKSSASSYKADVRRRYSNSWTPENGDRINPVQVKAKAIERVDVGISNGPTVVVIDEKGGKEIFNYVIAATGFERSVNSNGLVYDTDGNAIGRGNGTGVYYGGSYAGIEKGLLPQKLQNIIDGLGIPENTISMWVNAVLVQRLLWTIAAREEPNHEKLLQASV